MSDPENADSDQGQQGLTLSVPQTDPALSARSSPVTHAGLAPLGTPATVHWPDKKILESPSFQSPIRSDSVEDQGPKSAKRSKTVLCSHEKKRKKKWGMPSYFAVFP